ncbi:MAG TPA: arabinofuranosyltransferase [Pseudonocardiaceae bacterium]
MTRTLASPDGLGRDEPAAGSTTGPAAASTDAAGDGISLPTLPTGRRLGWAALEIVVGALLTALLSVALQFVISHTHASRPTFVPNDAIALGVSGLVLVALGLALWSLVRSRWPRWATALSWALLSVTPTLVVSFMLQGTRLYVGGLSIDQTFRTEYLTRMADSPALADFTYRGVAPFYPGAWFWLGGRFANLIGQPAWAAYKPWAILTLAVTAGVVFAVWSLVVRRPTAFLLALLTTAIGLTIAVDEPYSWLITATIPPLAVLGWRMLWRIASRPAGVRGGGGAMVVALGIGLGVYGILYTLYLFFFALVLVVLGALAVLLAARRRAADTPSVGALIGRVLSRLVLTGLVAVPVLLIVWTPYLLAVLSGQHGYNTAARYLPESGATVPTPMLDASVAGALCLLGTCWIVFAARRSPIAVALGTIVGVGYLWYLLSFALLALQTTLLAFRIYNILAVSLGAAGLFGALELARWANRRWRSRRRIEIRVLGITLSYVVLLWLVQGTPGLITPDSNAFNDYYPTGVTALGKASPKDADYWVPQLSNTIQQLTGKKPDQLVVLSNQVLMNSTTPYWLFQASTPHYADPLGAYEQRNALIRQWAAAGNPARLLAELNASPYEPPTVFVFTTKPEGVLQTTITRDVFPAAGNVEGDTVLFSTREFQDSHFTSRQVGPYTVVVRTS